MWVKVCGVTNEDDALLAVALGADAVGFIFAPSPRQMSVAAVRDIVRRVPPEIATVGVFRDELPQRVVEICGEAGLGLAQLHGHESSGDAEYVRNHVKGLIAAFAVDDPRIASWRDYRADLVIVDGTTPGAGAPWVGVEQAPALLPSSRLVIAGGLDADNVAQAITATAPFGVDVSRGVESRVGVKDAMLLKRFIENAKAAGSLVGAETLSDEIAPYDWMDEE